MDTQENKKEEVSTGDTQHKTAETPKEPVVDYKAELEAALERTKKVEEKLKKAEYTLKNKRIEAKKDENEEESFTKDDLDELLDKKLSERLTAVRAVESQDDVDDVLHHITDNEDERALIRHIYDNRISKTGFSRSQIREDLEAARLIANAKRYKKENDELAAAMAAKASLGHPSIGSNAGKTPALDDDYKKVFSQSDLQYMTSRGFTEDQMKKAASEIISQQGR